jgi:hypothetical protein
MMKADAIAAFNNPPNLYRGAPFWSWNNKLDTDQLCRQLDVFKEMGIGGAHIHPRTGLDTEYMGPEYLKAVRCCVDKAREEGMLVWLYDEDRWPSGFAGGLVTRDERWRARYLVFTPDAYEDVPASGGPDADSMARGGRTGNGRLLAIYDVKLDAAGCLAGYERMADRSTPPASGTTRWYAYLEVSRPSSWFNNQTYADTLNPEAIKRFIEVTHERYKAAIGDEFGKTVPAIFTDEPQFTNKKRLGKATDRMNLVIPFTDDLPETFQQAYGGDLLEHLPEVFWELPGKAASLTRYRYHDHVCERFAQAFADTIGGWCRNNGIALTGHMMDEPTLTSQTAALGEAMRHYRSFQIPGIDMLCDWMELTTAKQAQSAAHQYGCPGVLSELYGVTNWSFDFAGHKRQGDWQAALGVLFRVHHLALVSMAGEAKRDYPASISYQSPWWREYRVVEDHFARVGALLSRGRPHVRIGVIHPVESMWLCWGPDEQNAAELKARDTAFADLTRWLLHGLADFDFISESLLPTQAAGANTARFVVGEMAYDVVVVPAMRTIRATTLARLAAFAKAGGTVLFAGEVPSLVDAQPSDAPAVLAAGCVRLPWSEIALLDALAPVCDVRLVDARGAQVADVLHQMREEEGTRYLFLCNTTRKKRLPALELQVRGQWNPVLHDTLTGRTAPLSATVGNGWTRIPCELQAHGSLLLVLEPGQPAAALPVAPAQPVGKKEIDRLQDPVPVTLSEPNVLVLDYAAFQIDNEMWSDVLPILDLDGLIANVLGLPPRGGFMAQPWCDQEPLLTLATVRVQVRFASRVAVDHPQLALEGLADTRVFLDGIEQAAVPVGYFTDEAIQTIRLDAFCPGEHELELEIAYHRKTCIECMYLLGDFGVEVRGRYTLITEPVRELAFGNWVHQGLPFYAGNVTYHTTLPSDGRPIIVETAHYGGALVTARLDDGEKVPLAFAPYRACFDAAPGEHRLDLTVFGNLANAFGQLHNADAGGNNRGYYWWGPNSWRTKGANWMDEYQLWPMGLLSAPRLLETAG